jgi:hypothetical protein
MQPDNDLTRPVIGCAIEVRRTLGPGRLESVYKARPRNGYDPTPCAAWPALTAAETNVHHPLNRRIAHAKNP